MNPSGIYALVALDGAQIASNDAMALGFGPASGPIAARAVDDAMPGAINAAQGSDRVTLLLGHFDEPTKLCETLRLGRNADPIALARAGLERCGADLPAAALGEWTLLDWRADSGLTVMSSSARRDPVFFARHGNLIAIGPSLHCLGKLAWIDRTIDEAGMVATIGNYRLRKGMPGATLLGGVRRLPPGGSVRWHGRNEQVAQSRAAASPSRFTGTIHDAVDEATRLLRHIVGQRLDRVDRAGSLLSGGLDSTLIAWLLADQHKSNQAIACLCSAVDAKTGLVDETDKALILAEHLALRLDGVVPPDDLSPYRPSKARFERGAGLILDPRHYLYDALGEHAAERGISALFDGSYGEGTVTAHLPLATMRYRVRELLRRMVGRPNLWRDFDGISIARLAPHRLASMTQTYGKALDPAQGDAFRAVDPRGPWVFPPGADMRAAAPTELLPGRVRFEFPFRDARLLKLFASFPAAFMTNGGLDRAPARLILKDRVPEAIRLQRKGLAFAPDHNLRLKIHAADAAARIPEFRSAGIDDWLDLEWLGEALAQMSALGPQGLDSALEIQFTAMTAEFMLWWRTEAF